MSRNNRHIPQVIELAKFRNRDPITSPRSRRIELSPRQALYYNDHPDAIIENFDRSEYRAVLREIERHVVPWEQQQTPEQSEWVARARRRNHLSTPTSTGARLRVSSRFPRQIPVTVALARSLDEYRRLSAEPENAGHRVLGGVSGTRLSVPALRNVLRRASVEAAETSADVRPLRFLDLRYSGGRHLVEQGVPIAYVALVGGWGIITAGRLFLLDHAA